MRIRRRLHNQRIPNKDSGGRLLLPPPKVLINNSAIRRQIRAHQRPHGATPPSMGTGAAAEAAVVMAPPLTIKQRAKALAIGSPQPPTRDKEEDLVEVAAETTVVMTLAALCKICLGLHLEKEMAQICHGKSSPKTAYTDTGISTELHFPHYRPTHPVNAVGSP
jgi:hypothetical protein